MDLWILNFGQMLWSILWASNLIQFIWSYTIISNEPIGFIIWLFEYVSQFFSMLITCITLPVYISQFLFIYLFLIACITLPVIDAVHAPIVEGHINVMLT